VSNTKKGLVRCGMKKKVWGRNRDDRKIRRGGNDQLSRKIPEIRKQHAQKFGRTPTQRRDVDQGGIGLESRGSKKKKL